MSDTPVNRDTRKLKIWQQNLNKSLEGQLDLLQSLKDNDYDIVALQEPHIDFLVRTRSNAYWRVVYPSKRHLANPSKTRAVTLINRNISMNNWDEIPLDSADVTGVRVHSKFGIINLLNIYNDCKDNRSIGVVKEFMRSSERHGFSNPHGSERRVSSGTDTGTHSCTRQL